MVGPRRTKHQLTQKRVIEIGQFEDWRRRMLWQLLCRFDVGRDLYFDETGGRVAWDATAPIPSNKGPMPVRRWPGVTLHDPEVAERVDAWLAEGGY